MDTSKELEINLTLRIQLKQPVSALPKTFSPQRVIDAAYDAMMSLDENVAGKYPNGKYEIKLVLENCLSCKKKNKKSCPHYKSINVISCDSWERK